MYTYITYELLDPTCRAVLGRQRVCGYCIHESAALFIVGTGHKEKDMGPCYFCEEAKRGTTTPHPS